MKNYLTPAPYQHIFMRPLGLTLCKIPSIRLLTGSLGFL
ncbi:hypothetical protein Xets_00694 [Xenorhabdus sp. TS4]|nr:hypothetical protein [Xenorhabdus sp. TS4]